MEARYCFSLVNTELYDVFYSKANRYVPSVSQLVQRINRTEQFNVCTIQHRLQDIAYNVFVQKQAFLRDPWRDIDAVLALVSKVLQRKKWRCLVKSSGCGAQRTESWRTYLKNDQVLSLRQHIHLCGTYHLNLSDLTLVDSAALSTLSLHVPGKLVVYHPKDREALLQRIPLDAKTLIVTKPMLVGEWLQLTEEDVTVTTMKQLSHMLSNCGATSSLTNVIRNSNHPTRKPLLFHRKFERCILDCHVLVSSTDYEFNTLCAVQCRTKIQLVEQCFASSKRILTGQHIPLITNQMKIGCERLIHPLIFPSAALSVFEQISYRFQGFSDGEGAGPIEPSLHVHKISGVEGSLSNIKKLNDLGVQYQAVAYGQRVGSQEVCYVCQRNSMDSVLSPCEHLICFDCANHLRVRNCPLCRSPIEGVKTSLSTPRSRKVTLLLDIVTLAVNQGKRTLVLCNFKRLQNQLLSVLQSRFGHASCSVMMSRRRQPRKPPDISIYSTAKLLGLHLSFDIVILYHRVSTHDIEEFIKQHISYTQLHLLEYYPPETS